VPSWWTTLKSVFSTNKFEQNRKTKCLCFYYHCSLQIIPRHKIESFHNLMWPKAMVFYYENQPVTECVGFKGLPQGSALSPLSFSFYTSQADRILPVCCSVLQYADDLAVYASHVDVENVQRMVQPACTGPNKFSRTLDCRYLSQSLSSYYSQRNTLILQFVWH
jgi:hypothetical protein